MTSDRKNLDWNALAEEFYNMVKDSTPETAVRVELTTNDDVPDGFNVLPAETNVAHTFFHTEELVDFARCKGLSNYVSVSDGMAVARVY